MALLQSLLISDRAEAAAKGWAISPYGQRKQVQTDRDWASFRHPWGWENEPNTTTQTSVLPNRQRAHLPKNCPGGELWAGSSVLTTVSWLPQTEP